MATTDLAATYAALILADGDVTITADKIIALTSAAGIELETIWATLLAKALEGKNISDLLSNITADAGKPANVVKQETQPTPPAEDDSASARSDKNDDSDDEGIMGTFELFN